MWLVQIHDSHSNGLDYFQLFTVYEDARKQFKELIIENGSYLNFDWYEEVFDEMEQEFHREDLLDWLLKEINVRDNIIYLEDDKYLSLTNIQPDGKQVRSRS